MTTNVTLITDALREINVINEVQAPSSEQGSQCLSKLNRMMEVWKEEDIDLGWFAQTDPEATAPIPDWSETLVILGLAIRCAPQYGATITPETAAAYRSVRNTVLSRLINNKLDGADMTHMPGGNRGRYDIQNDI